MNKAFPITFSQNFLNNIQSSLMPVGMYYLPVGILLATMIVAAILMTLSCCCMCCCQCCCKARLRKKYSRKTPPSKLKKGVAWCLYFLPILVVGLSIAAHLGGVNHFTVGLNRIQSGSNLLLDNSKGLIDKTVPTLTTVMDNLKIGVNQAIDMAVDSVSLASLDTSVIPPLNAMCDELIVAQSGVDRIKTSANQITTDVNTLKTRSNDLMSSTFR
jgi:hypothetical protein